MWMKHLEVKGLIQGSMTFRRGRFGAAVSARPFRRRDVSATRHFGAETFRRRDISAPRRFDAETIWRGRLGAMTFQHFFLYVGLRDEPNPLF